MQERPRPFAVYRHFKGKNYQVLTIAEKEDTGEELVIYQGLYPPYKVYARNMDSFLSEVDAGRYPEYAGCLRFEEISAADAEGPADAAEYRQAPAPRARERSVRAPGREELISAFYDTRSAAERIRILRRLSGQLSETELDSLGYAAGVSLDDGSAFDREMELMSCLQLMAKYEERRS